MLPQKADRSVRKPLNISVALPVQSQYFSCKKGDGLIEADIGAVMKQMSKLGFC
jgi:hypothetical protein